MENGVKVNVVKAQNGYFININDSTSWSHDFYTVDGVSLKRAYKQGWYISPSIPECFHLKRNGQSINHRFDLKPEVTDEMVTALNLKRVLDKEDCLDVEKSGCNYDFVWRDEFALTHQFYEYKYDTPIIDIVIDVEVNQVLEIDAPIGGSEFQYKVYRTRWTHEGVTNLTNKDIKTAFEYSLLYPGVIEEHLPCHLTAKQSYDIVRMFIKENINPKVAYISSDYDFCLTVKKKISLHNEIYQKKEIKTATGRSYKNRKYRDVYIRERDITVFEMAPAPYQGYPVIRPFTGTSHDDLKFKVDQYLNSVIEEINTPLKDCPHCNGMGVVLKAEI